MVLPLWIFFALLMAHASISTFIIAFSSSGWSMIFFPIMLSLFFTGVFIVAFIISLILYKKNVSEIIVSKKIIFFVIFLQLLAIFFNYGDCGDSPGGSMFFERIFSLNSTECQSAYSSPNEISFSFWFLFIFLYLIMIATTYWKARINNNSSITLN